MSTTNYYHQDNAIVAADGNPQLVLPSYATHAVKQSKHSGLVTCLTVPKVLRRTAPNVPRDICIIARDQALQKAGQCRTFAQLQREDISAVGGNNGGLNPYPISGGVCDHWPESDKNLVIAYVRLAQAHTALALAWHLYAGKRAHTFQANQ